MNLLKWNHLQSHSCIQYGFSSHPKYFQNVGYIITIDGINIYQAGDTCLIPEIKTLKNIDVALIPIDGGRLTMKTEEAASFINQILPKLVIPALLT